MGLSCLNCKKEVAPAKIRLFLEATLCEDCHRIAERVHQVGMQELKLLENTLGVVIQQAILHGHLALEPETESEAGSSHFKLLHLLSKPKKESAKWSPVAYSSHSMESLTTPLAAASVDGLHTCDSQKVRNCI